MSKYCNCDYLESELDKWLTVLFDTESYGKEESTIAERHNAFLAEHNTIIRWLLREVLNVIMNDPSLAEYEDVTKSLEENAANLKDKIKTIFKEHYVSLLYPVLDFYEGLGFDCGEVGSLNKLAHVQDLLKVIETSQDETEKGIIKDLIQERLKTFNQ